MVDEKRVKNYSKSVKFVMEKEAQKLDDTGERHLINARHVHMMIMIIINYRPDIGLNQHVSA
jgi:hypothetical protein